MLIDLRPYWENASFNLNFAVAYSSMYILRMYYNFIFISILYFVLLLLLCIRKQSVSHLNHDGNF